MPIGSTQAPIVTKQEPRAVSYAPGYKEPAAATPTNAATETTPAPVNAETTPAVDASPTDAAPIVEPTKTELRKQYLQESKLARKAQEERKKAQQELKQAKELVAKAEKFAQLKDDPIKALREIGEDPEKFYRQMTRAYVNPDNKPDPIEQKVKEVLSPYLKAQEEEKVKAQRHNDLVAETQVVHGDVLPMMQDPDKYPAILAFNQQQPGPAAVAVYNKVKSHWLETGQIITFQQAADKMEEEYSIKIEDGIKLALGMKKFSKYVSKENQSDTGTNPASPEPKQTARTLTNSKGPSIGAVAETISGYSIGNAKLDKLLKKHNLK